MNVKDFEYADEYLSGWGCMVCEIDAPNGFETIASDSQRTFDSVSQAGGKHFPLTTSYYSDHIEMTFQICKFRCPQGLLPFTVYEIRELKRWLNRPEYHKFKLVQPDWADIYMMGSFNISEIKFGDETYALELTFISDRPFALHEPVSYKFELQSKSDEYIFYDKSDEIGHIYPHTVITCLSGGNMELVNAQEPERITVVNNVSKGEVITFAPNLIISTALLSHAVQNDFNFKFPRIVNTYGNRRNAFTCSLPVKIELTYSPYVKVVR